MIEPILTEQKYEYTEEDDGKIVTTYAVLTSSGLPEVAKAWEVTDKTEEAFGKLGAGTKYMARADFRYKDELVFALYLSSDIGVRLFNL